MMTTYTRQFEAMQRPRGKKEVDGLVEQKKEASVFYYSKQGGKW